MRYFDAMVYLALIAEIHGTDDAILKAAKRYSKSIERRYRTKMFDILNSKRPCFFVMMTVATMPEHILTMDPSPVAAPHILLNQRRVGTTQHR